MACLDIRVDFSKTLSFSVSTMRTFTRFCLVLIFSLFFCLDLNAKSVLLKNGRRIENVKIKPVADGFEMSHPNGKIERIPLSKVLKIFLSDDVPKSARIPEPNSKTEIANKDASPTNDLSETKPKKSGVAVFSEGLLPGWSRMARSDSYSVKGLGFFFIFAEIALAYKTYQITQAPSSVSDFSNPIALPSVLVALSQKDANALIIGYANVISSSGNLVKTSDGRIMQKEQYEKDKESYMSAFLFVLLMDAILGYSLEDRIVVPKLNVSLQSKEISAGVTIRF